ncbi:CHAT domain-containing protein [Anaerolineales bacterium HSG6]|nr:CHAT domain-containing protein [Anaerolineales bacterium HSG6]
MLEITLQRQTDDGYPVVVEESQLGTFLPIRTESLLQLDIESLNSQTTPLAYGTILGQALFQGEIRDAFTRARSENQDGLRLLLAIEDPDLKTLYWERLCTPVTGGRWQFLKLDQRVIFSLYLPSLTDLRFPPIGRRDLRALILTANPDGLDRYKLASFDEAATIASVQAALGDIPSTVLGGTGSAGTGSADILPAGLPTLDNLVAQLTAEDYSLLHIVAHGRYIKSKGETAIYLANADNQVEPVPVTKLIDRLSHLQRLPHLTFLSTCESANPKAESGLGGFAQRLIRKLGMPAVVAMTEPVTIKSAGVLASEFYQRLRKHGHADLALTEATIRLAEAHDVTVPALYSRLGERPLFSEALDKILTNSEIEFGLERLDDLLTERAPVLKPKLAEQKTVLERTLQTAESTLSPAAQSERQTALTEINSLCEEALEFSFNALALDETPPDYDARCPFPGLESFRDSTFFFGRETLVNKLVAKLLPDEDMGSNFLAVLGPSGSGKSSVILAGLVPALDYPYVRMVPSYDPMPQLAAALAELNEQHLPELPTGERGEKHTSEEEVPPQSKIQNRQSKIDHAVLVVDQFEEIFTLCSDEEQRQQFFDTLLKLAHPEQRTALTPLEIEVVITMRADFWGECASYPMLKEAMQANQELIGPMSSAELRSAMEQQARAVGLRFEADLSQTILDEVQGEPGAMPLLQHALLELWHRRHGRWIRAEEYRALGGIQQAIASSADQIYDEHTPAEQAHLREIFSRLTRLDVDSGEGHRDTRRRIQFDELLTDPTETETIRQLVQRLASARLIVTSVNSATGQQELEVTHEALIRHWPRLRHWLDEGRDMLRIREEVSHAAQAWDSAEGKAHEQIQHRGSRLEEVEQLAEQKRLRLNEQEQRYLTACVGERTRSKRRTQSVIGVLSVLLFIALMAGGFGWIQRGMAQQEAENAQFQKNTAEAASTTALEERATAQSASTHAINQQNFAEAEKDNAQNQQATAQAASTDAIEQQSIAELQKTTAEAASADALNQQATAEAERNNAEQQLDRSNALRVAAQADDLLESNPLQAGLVALASTTITETEAANNVMAPVPYNYPPIEKIMWGHERAIWSMAYHPDGTQFASASSDGTVKLWDTATGQLIQTLENHTDTVWSMAYHPDGTQLASASSDGTVKLWDTATGQLIQTLENHTDTVWSVAYSPDGTQLASASQDKTIILWDLKTHKHIDVLTHTSAVHCITYSPKGEQLAFALDDNSIILWDVATEQPIRTLQGHTANIASLTYNSDGSQLASASYDQTIKLWDVATGEIIHTLEGHTGSVLSIAYSMKSNQLISASDDRTIKVWDIMTGENIETLTGHRDAVLSVAYHPDGNQLVSGALNGIIILWDRQSINTLTGHVNPVWSVAYHPDGHQLASTSDDKTIKLWDTMTGQPINTLTGHTDAVWSVAYHPDGHQLASGSADRSIKLWDMTTMQSIKTLTGHTETVYGVVYSPDGNQLASASNDHAIKLWDVATGQPSFTLTGHTEAIYSVAYNPDGTQLASGSQDKTIRLWDVATGQNSLALTLTGPTDMVFSVAYSPDGKQLASGLADGTIRLWNVMVDENTQTITMLPDLILTGHTGAIYNVTYSPDGKQLASTAWKNDIILWDVATGKPIQRFIGHTDSSWRLAYHPHGTQLASASSDKTIRLLDGRFLGYPCQWLHRNLTYNEWQQFVPPRYPYRLLCNDLPLPPLHDAVNEARGLAETGQVDEAVALFEQLLTLDPSLGINPQAEANRVFSETVQAKYNEAVELARSGDITASIIMFEELVQIDPSQTINPQTEAHRWAEKTPQNIMENGLGLAQTGSISEALAKFEEAQTKAMEDNLDFSISAEAWHTVCVEGVKYEQAEQALTACNQAIELDEDNGGYYAARGMAYLQLGQVEKAKADIERFEEWRRGNEE